MNKLTRILAVLDGSNADAVIIAKAVALARQHGASLELFLCDAERAYALLRAYDQSGVEESRANCIRDWRRYLECLRDVAVGADVPIRVDAMCESPLYQGIVRKALDSECDLVIKNATSAHPLRRFAWDANDWQLMRTCPTTLLFSRGRSWQPCPRFAAAVDVSEQETAELGEEILRTSALLSRGIPCELDVLYSEPADVEQREHKQHLATLEALTFGAVPRGTTVQVLSGPPEKALPAFASSRGYDLFIMGALTHQKGLAALVGTLTAKLVETLECDFVLVKPSTYRPEVELTGERESVIPFVPAVAAHYNHWARGS
jgi:universal stress protein E